MALLSAFRPNEALLSDHVGLFRGLMVAGGIGTILTAGYFLWMLQRVNMGSMPERWNEHSLGDINSIEWASWIPLLVLILALGLFPRLIFGVSQEAVSGLMGALGHGG
jgi:NADH-quinone oxidoreductase subunit M